MTTQDQEQLQQDISTGLTPANEGEPYIYGLHE